MNRRTTLAALILVGAASFAAAPSYAQTSNALMDAKIPSEKAPAPKAGVAPRISPIAGATSGAAAQEALSTSSAPALQQAPANSLLRR